jgi:hypothetical protein
MQMFKPTIQCSPFGFRRQDGSISKDQPMETSNFRSPPFDDTGHTDGSDRALDESPALASTTRQGSSRNRVSSVQLMAWFMANWGYQVPDGSIYRAEAVKLYQEDMHERITTLFADLDAQNARICAALHPAA